ncbi:DUF4181 domain-containing protein [Scopulibacillus cellulosilyticus]|uniref:DUF4181 domain-containing protein n=1 Tax=Scopulibacillus cellulosilyticus TaxID=2665665 RepID=A0ABW2PSZ0_9BACL
MFFYFAAIIFIFFILILGNFNEKIIRKKLCIPKQEEGFFYKTVNDIHKRGETIIFIIFLLGIVLSVIFNFDSTILLIPFFIVLYCFRAFMEWKYKRNNKEYIITFFGLVIYLIALLPIISYLNK